MPDFKIIGTPNPVVGVTETYSIDFSNLSTIPSFQIPSQDDFKTTFENQVKWTVHVLEYGRWRQTKENEKYGNPITYTFYQRSLNRDGLRIKAEINGLSTRIDIKAQNAECPKILAIDLLDSEGNKPKKQFTYGEWFIARVHGIHMNNRRIFVTLWEDDSKGPGHNKGNTFIKSEEGIVKEGIADIKFFLDPSNIWLANARLAPGDQNEGKNHEYYVTAEFFFNGSPHNLASSNTNVPNPDYKPESLKQTPAEQKGISKKDTKGINKAENKVFDYQEAKVSVKPVIEFNPVRERYNKVMTVNVDDKWWEKKEEKKNGICQRCDEDFNYKDIVNIFPAASKNQTLANKLITEINSLRIKYEINTCLRKAHLINQFGSETGFNTLIEEIDNYSVTTLTNLFGYFKRHPNEAETYKGNLYEIAVRAYGLRKVDKEEDIISCVSSPSAKCNDLGNESKEDGYTYIGRGLIQLTGKYNYSQINKDFIKAFPGKGNLLKNPELLEEPKYAAMSAFSYWINNNLNLKADAGSNASNVDAITKIINKNLDASHYEKRRKTFVKAKEVYRLDECKNTVKDSTSTSVVIRLVRKWQTRKSTIGEFTIDNSDITGYILEEKGPDTTISGIEQRIPIGTYNLVWHNGTKFKGVLKLHNSDVNENRAILIHSGNSAEATEGCLLPGSSRSLDWVSKSKDKLEEINDYVKLIGIENAKIIITQDYE